jgi:hypothetical protein
LDSLEPAKVINALDDKSRDVRVNAVRDVRNDFSPTGTRQYKRRC